MDSVLHQIEFQERIPPVARYQQYSLRLGSCLIPIVSIAILISLDPTSRQVIAQDMVPAGQMVAVEQSVSLPWWHSLYYKSNGMPRYGKGFANSTRHHEWRIPVNPPLSGPSYGYYQPCWRQVPVVRRCVTCETFPSDREIPNLNSSYPSTPTPMLDIPPAPAATGLDDKPESTKSSDPDDSAPEKNADEPMEAPKATDDTDDFS